MNYRSIKDLKFEIIDGDRGKNYPTPEDLHDKGYCLFLNNKNIESNKLSLRETTFITKSKHEIMKNGSLRVNNLVLTTRGTIGNCLLIDNAFPLPARINSGMVIIKTSSSFLPRYVYYFFSSEAFNKQVKQLQSGAAQPQLPIKDLQNIIIPVVCIHDQQHIVNTISSLFLKSL